jgi:hypothetical protein
MDSITFRCKACATLLKVRADRAGHKIRCKRCGAVTTPARELTESEPEELPAGDDGDPDAKHPQSVPAPARRRKRPRRQPGPSRLADLRNAPGWRKVRLGLILIALAMCSGLLWFVVSFFVPLGWAPWRFLVQALPLVGNILCAFVPLKGTARGLTLANLGVIALGLALAVVADRMLERSMRESTARSDELLEKLTRAPKEAGNEEEELNKKLAELRKKARAGDREAVKEQQQVNKKLTELRTKRAAEDLEALKQVTAEFTAASDRALVEMERIGRWAHVSVQVYLLQQFIQIIILSFFIQAIARALGEKDLAASCPRVALAALVTLGLLLAAQLVPPSVKVVFWIVYLLGLGSFVLQGLLLVEACAAISKHLERRST